MRKITEDKIVVKMHRFTLNILKSTVKGSFKKTKNGLWKAEDADKFVYECAPCGTALQLNKKWDLYILNKEITLRFPCI